MICTSCGSEILDDSRFCSKCGAPVLVKEAGEPTSNKQCLVNDYVYAVCTKIDPDKKVCYYSLSGYSLFCVFPMSYLSAKGISFKKGDGLWIYITELEENNRVKASITLPNKIYLYNDFKWFYERYSVNDTIFAPITSKSENYIEVNLTVNIINRVFKNQFDDPVVFDSIEEGDVREFTIASIEKTEDNKINISLVPTITVVNEDKLWTNLPESLDYKNTVISSRIIEYLDEGVLDFLGCSNSMINSKELFSIISDIYKKRYDDRDIYIEKRGKEINIDFLLGYKNSNGVPEAVYMKRDVDNKWVLSTIMPARAERMMKNLVFIPDTQKMVDELADICLIGEEWDFGNIQTGEKKILRYYLYFSFYKAWIDGIIVENSHGAIFNTGLVDNAYDDIYCYLSPNTDVDFYKRKWRFGYFACIGKEQKGKELNRMFADYPAPPSYIDTDNLSNLFFDTKKKLSCDYDHIIMDNISRLPYTFLRSRVNYDKRLNPLFVEYESDITQLDKDKILSEIYKIITEDSDDGQRLRRDIQTGLISAIETSKKYCKWNYKTAIPVYYSKTNSISLLLPLKLSQEDDIHADVALVVEKLENGNYQGQTIFTLEMAYQDARQICRPNSDWLVPHDIRNKGGR